MVIVQVIAAYAVSSFSWPLVILAAYVFGGTINHSMALAIHEISHNLAFGHSRPMANRFLGMFGNVIIGLPTSVTFKRYHLEHHRYQGVDGIDMDIPSAAEGVLFRNTFTKVIWVLLQPFFLRFSPALSSAKTRHRLGNCQLGSPDFFQCRHSLLFRRKILGLLDLRLLSGDGSSPHGRSLH